MRTSRALVDRALPAPPGVKNILDEAPARLVHVRAVLAEATAGGRPLSAIAARGAPLAPVPSGTYRVNRAMLDDCHSERFVMHVSRLGAILAGELAREHNVPAFIVDPVSVDEFEPVARVSGLAECPRVSLLHALNIKRAARRFARERGQPYESLKLIVAHLGGGCSIAVHKDGRMIDAVDANGEGPFAPERSGGLRADALVRLCFSGRFNSAADALRHLTREGGLMSHLGTTDAKEVEARIAGGDEKAALVYEAFAYQVAKHIAALAAAVNGRVDGVVLTGGLARSEYLARRIGERVAFLGRVAVYPGEEEMAALYEGVVRVLEGRERARVYPTGDFENAPAIL